jgi:hypothetical protein
MNWSSVRQFVLQQTDFQPPKPDLRLEMYEARTTPSCGNLPLSDHHKGTNFSPCIPYPRKLQGPIVEPRFEERLCFRLPGDRGEIKAKRFPKCSPSVPLRQIEGLREGRISGSS